MTLKEEEELIRIQKSLLNASMEKLKSASLCGGKQPNIEIVSAAVADVAALTTTPVVDHNARNNSNNITTYQETIKQHSVR